MQEQLDYVRTKLAQALDHGQFDVFLQIERAFYNCIVRRCEQIEHYELCYSTIDQVVARFGEAISGALPPRQDSLPGRICYILPSLDTDLAHVEFLFNILKMHPAKDPLEIIVAGYSASADSIGSRLLARLQQEDRIRIVRIPLGVRGMVDFGRFFVRERLSLLIVFSIPHMLSAWVRALGADRVAWATTKFELPSFAGLRHRLSFAGPRCEATAIRGKIWRRSIASLCPADVPVFSSADRPRTRMLSVNREEKMLTPHFLGAVADVLAAEPATRFSWTGRDRNPQIVEFFARRGLAARTDFIGWVTPSHAIGDHDIFLDTYGLSGMVATYAFCAGMPVQFFRASKSWLEIHESRIAADTPTQAHLLRSTLASDPASYSASVIDLVRSATSYNERSAWQSRIGTGYLLDERAMYEGHVAAIRGVLADSGAEQEAPA